ncbi:hypothetical protein SKAU_G00282790 [Synaphobranchus kaupii]|uniref:Uncharacterized protein n=1 Tax=Synaphobranchus kaupii TaxID=118154 RepID=A0A9Q1EXD2_SYNKA|nr:hypothetical protein SKAU_G00282790 [Synaphobranchus kaupii]
MSQQGCDISKEVAESCFGPESWGESWASAVLWEAKRKIGMRGERGGIGDLQLELPNTLYKGSGGGEGGVPCSRDTADRQEPLQQLQRTAPSLREQLEGYRQT